MLSHHLKDNAMKPHINFLHIFITAILALPAMIFAQNHAPAASTPDITGFYKEYILLQAAENPDTARIYSLLSRYCSDSLIDDIKSGKYDYDIILQTQDCDSTWAQNVVVADDDCSGIYYTDPVGKTIACLLVDRGASGKIKDIELSDILDIQYRKSINHKMFTFNRKSTGKSGLGRKKKIFAKYIACGKDINNGSRGSEAIKRITGNDPLTAIQFTYLENNIDYGDFYFTIKNDISDTICNLSPGTILALDITFYNNVPGYHYNVPYALVDSAEILHLPSELDSLLWSTEGYRIFQYDNGDDYPSDGLFRIIDKDNLIGYATESGEVAIQPRFAFGNPFNDGKAKVTDTGKLKEVPGSNGEYHYWESNDWYWIDKTGKRIE